MSSLDSIRGLIAQEIEPALDRMEGSEALKAIAESTNLEGIEITSFSASGKKWMARGLVKIHLVNWDDEQFGEVRLHMIASGQDRDSETRVDSLIISPNLH